jgi:hypothetical protein
MQKNICTLLFLATINKNVHATTYYNSIATFGFGGDFSFNWITNPDGGFT